MSVKAYCLLSGGLDSLLAIHLLRRQNIETVGVHFRSAFFDKSEKVSALAKAMGIQLQILDITEEHFELVKNPSYGYGKNLNPCIDCHALMLKKTAALLDRSKSEFVATGEVLNQRPMSQNKNSLLRVEIYSGLKDLLLRPLSAKLLPPTLPEREGWVNRETLLDFYGKNRRPQMDLAKEWGIKNYETPAGGCRLTDATFASRLIKLKEKGLFKRLELIQALNYGRIIEIAPEKIIIVSRNQKEGEALKQIGAELRILGENTMGPAILGFGDFLPEEENLAAKIFSFYSKARGENPASLVLNGKILNLDPFNRVLMEEEIKRMLIV